MTSNEGTHLLLPELYRQFQARQLHTLAGRSFAHHRQPITCVVVQYDLQFFGASHLEYSVW